MLTLVLLSNNRPKFLRRSVLFWNKFNFEVIIIDGSDFSQEKWIKDNSNNNIFYIHKQLPFPQRLKLATELIKTKYTIFVPDDEYYLPNMLEYCVEFLEKNEEYVAVNGLAIGFDYKDNKVLGYYQYPEWKGRERTEEEPEKRIVSHMSSYANSLTTSVTRTNLWKRCAELYAKYDFHIYALWELEMNLLLSFAGKSKTFNQLMKINSTEKSSPPIRNNISTLSPKNNIFFFWNQKKFLKQKKTFIDILTQELMIISKIKDYNYCKKAIINSIDEYCKQKNIRVVFYTKFLFFYKSPKIKNIIKKFLSFFERKNNKNISDLIQIAKNLEQENVKVNYKELIIVQKSIETFYKIS